MKVVQSLFGLVFVAWFGFLFFYFSGVADSSPFMAQQLGPTIIGVGALALLLGVPIVIRMIQGGASFAGKVKPKKDPAEDVPQMSDFDADNAIERYLKKKAAAGEPVERPAQPAAAAMRQAGGFGRKGA